MTGRGGKLIRRDGRNIGRGPFLERLLFRYRGVFLALFGGATLFLAHQAVQIRPDASFLKMIPIHHPYLQNYLTHQEDLKGLGNAVRIAVETTEGDIFSESYMAVLRKITDEMFYLPGVHRAALKSLWTPLTRWIAVTEEGFEGGAVVPDTYDGSPASLELLRINVLKSGEVGSLVADNFKSSVVYVPLLDIDPETGERLDYFRFSQKLEEIRRKYQSETIRIHITGFAKIVGDLVEGAKQVGGFFGVTLVITLGLLMAYFRFPRSALVPLFCSITGVVWQLGILRTLGYGLDPYSMLIPFLIFAIGVSHGVQIINAVQHEVMDGADKVTAARMAFRSLYVPGLAALVTDGIGFATLMVIRIEVIQDLATGACIGVAVLILTNLLLLPVIMSYAGVSGKAVQRLRRQEEKKSHPLWRFVARFTDVRWAVACVLCLAALYGWGAYAGRNLKIGDLDRGAAEFWPDSRYNRDSAFMTENYLAGSDVFVVMLETPESGNSDYVTVVAVDRLQAKLEQLEGVQSTASLVDYMKLLNGAFNEGNVKWMAYTRSKILLDGLVIKTPRKLCNLKGTLSAILIFLKDHKAETLARVVDTVAAFAAEHDNDRRRFLMAAGDAGIKAVTNIVIEQAQYRMLLWVYGVVIVLILLTFRSWRAVVCIILPLGLTSALCRALMSWLGIGVKVSTLPVIALGVGIGVDYGIYIYNKFRFYRNQGQGPAEAYYRTLKTTGRAVVFTGVTLAIGVCTWAFSPIKFQADMGILLTFMFLMNMVGAVVILPALHGLTSLRTGGRHSGFRSGNPGPRAAGARMTEEVN